MQVGAFDMIATGILEVLATLELSSPSAGRLHAERDPLEQPPRSS